MQRICINPKDIIKFTGTSERQARNIIKKVKAAYNKETHQMVTINEVCQYLGINADEVIQAIK